MNIKTILEMLKLYSIQVILVLASINVAALGADAPAWLIGLINFAGVVAGFIARSAPQPKVVAAIATAKTARE